MYLSIVVLFDRRSRNERGVRLLIVHTYIIVCLLCKFIQSNQWVISDAFGWRNGRSCNLLRLFRTTFIANDTLHNAAFHCTIVSIYQSTNIQLYLVVSKSMGRWIWWWTRRRGTWWIHLLCRGGIILVSYNETKTWTCKRDNGINWI